MLVKTLYGISKSFYTGTNLEPLFGTGQGSGASPAIWLSLVVIIMNDFDKLITSHISINSPDPDTQYLNHTRRMDAFVDDTSLSLSDEGHLSYNQLVAELAKMAQTWEALPSHSGGALNLSKCSYYIMFWHWIKGRPQLAPTITTHSKLIVTIVPTNDANKLPIKHPPRTPIESSEYISHPVEILLII